MIIMRLVCDYYEIHISCLSYLGANRMIMILSVSVECRGLLQGTLNLVAILVYKIYLYEKYCDKYYFFRNFQ